MKGAEPYVLVGVYSFAGYVLDFVANQHRT